MRLFKVALATLAICLEVFCLVVALFGVADYASCRAEIEVFRGPSQSLVASVCSYDPRPGFMAVGELVILAGLVLFLVSHRQRLARGAHGPQLPFGRSTSPG